MISGKRLAKTLANAAHHKLAFDIELLDVKNICSFASYFLILSGKNKIHVDALKEELQETLKLKGGKPLAVEGGADSGWIIMDIGDIIVHIFHPAQRAYYNLFSLWGDAPAVPLAFTEKPPAKKASPSAAKPRKKKNPAAPPLE